MTSPEPNFNSLVDALRSDLPSKSDEQRVRRRLLAAGVGVTVGVVAPGAAAAGLVRASSLPATLLQKLGALSWMTKVGLAGVAATVALPAAVHFTYGKANEPVLDAATAKARGAARSVARAPAVIPLPASRPRVAAEAPATEPNEGRERTPNPSGAGSLHQGSATNAAESSGRASSAAFPMDGSESARVEGTLREETALVERALYALRLGDREGARRTLEEHARRFPNGLLARERDHALTRANSREDPNGAAAPR